MLPRVSQQILSRVAIGNYLLSTSTLLTPSADPLSVAQTVLVAHDASELVLAALGESVGFTSKERTNFMEYVVEIERVRGPLGISLFFKELNGARVSFKHSGILPTAQQFHDCIAKARLNLDRACLACLGKSIGDVSLDMLIEDVEARQSYEQAKRHQQRGEFEDALKSLGLCFRQALDATPFAYYVTVGEADTEAALHLVGCGVDPSTFLSLQKFLPSVSWNETRWNLRGTGHAGNWTRESVDYCLEVTLKIVLQIQHAAFAPHAMPFEYVFEDVLTAKTDGVVLNSERGGLYGLLSRRDQTLRNVVGVLNKGQQITGHITPAYQADSSYKWEKTHWDLANVYIVSSPKGETLGKLESGVELLIRADLVDVSYRPADDPSIREKYPHLFPWDRAKT